MSYTISAATATVYSAIDLLETGREGTETETTTNVAMIGRSHTTILNI